MLLTGDDRLARYLPEVLRRRREELDVGQDEVGKRAGLSGSTISKLEIGLTRLAIHHLQRLAPALEIESLSHADRLLDEVAGTRGRTSTVTRLSELREVTGRRVVHPGESVTVTERLTVDGRELVVTTTYSSLLSPDDEAQGLLYR